MKKLLNRKGIITLVTMLILAAVGALEIGMVVTSQLNSAAANNYLRKIQTYNAADGMITLLSQDILDFNEDNYLVGSYPPSTSCDIGTTGDPQAGGSYSCDTINHVYTLQAGGSDIQGNADHFRFAYMPFSGNIDVIVRVNSISAANGWSKAGIMIRQNLTAGSQNVYCCLTPTASNKGNIQYRNTAGGSTTNIQVGTFTAPQFLRLTRSGTSYSASYSPDGSAWTSIGTDNLILTDPCYVGFAVTSHTTGAICTAVFSQLSGLPLQTFTDTVNVGADSVPVLYTINRMGTDIFSMSAQAYIYKGPSKAHSFVTLLNQNLSREAAGSWHTTAKDSVKVPITLYDFRSNMSNPEFNVKAWINNSSGKSIAAHFVRDSLDQDRKPQLKPDHSGFREAFLNLYGSNWYSLDSCTRIHNEIPFSWNHPVGDQQKKDTLAKYGGNFSWCFCDSLYKWFRPSKAPGAVFDPVTGKWSNLKNRPKYNAAMHNWSDIVPNEWVGQSWDSTDNFANIVVYDSLQFRDAGGDTGLFVFGDQTKVVTNHLDTQYFVLNCNYSCNAACKLGLMGCATDTESQTESEALKFTPLKNRGFKYEENTYIPIEKNNACVNSENFAFTMEIHRTFTFKPNETFYFKGDDDVWLFINNILMLDIGGIHSGIEQLVKMDTVGQGTSNKLILGNQYNFDFFYCERNPGGADILITTNMELWTPPQPLKRSWKRDYGNLD